MWCRRRIEKISCTEIKYYLASKAEEYPTWNK
jgi:hypothetical protein